MYDETGRELGLLSQVSGNGMNIEVSSLPFAQSLVPGRRMRISIIESSSRETNVVDVVVRRLRSKVDDPFEVKLVHTIRGVGYVLRRG